MWQVIGQAGAVDFLRKSLERDSVAHAYLFVGPPHTGKTTLAVNLARALNCQAPDPPCGECDSCRKIASMNHADIQFIGLAQTAEEGKQRAEIGIDQIRQMQHSAFLPPFEGSRKVFIVNGAECLSTEAANCLLKTLEEPVGRVVFLLLTSNEAMLPVTVVSRCQRIELRPLSAPAIESALKERGIEPAKARLLSRLAHGGVGWAISASLDDTILQQHAEKMDRVLGIIGGDSEERFAYAAQLASQYGQNRRAVQDVLCLWLDYWRDLLLVKLDCPETVTNIDRIDALVKTAGAYSVSKIKLFINSIQSAAAQLALNANPRLVLEVMMLDMPAAKARVALPRS